MPKLSDIKIDLTRFRGKGIRPWNDPKVIKPNQRSDSSEQKDLSLKQKKQKDDKLMDGEHKVSIKLAKGKQGVSTEKALSEHKVSNTLAEPLANQESIINKDRGGDVEKIDMLVGKERELLYFLFQKCRISASLVSPTITSYELKNYLKIKAEHLRNLIYRVLRKDVISIVSIKKGKGGWRKFRFSKEIFQYISLNYSVSNALAEPLAALTSSSNINIKTTTNNMVSENWRNIDIDPLALIGFSETHLSQIASRNKLSPNVVQDSIYAFAFDIQENGKKEKIKGDPINFFMGILRKGEPYVPPSNYESPQDKKLRIYHERMQGLENERKAREKEAKDLAYNDWFSKRTDDQKSQFLPENMRRNAKIGKSKFLEGAAKKHFDDEVWPELKKEITR